MTAWVRICRPSRVFLLSLLYSAFIATCYCQTFDININSFDGNRAGADSLNNDGNAAGGGYGGGGGQYGYGPYAYGGGGGFNPAYQILGQDLQQDLTQVVDTNPYLRNRWRRSLL